MIPIRMVLMPRCPLMHCAELENKNAKQTINSKKTDVVPLLMDNHGLAALEKPLASPSFILCINRTRIIVSSGSITLRNKERCGRN